MGTTETITQGDVTIYPYTEQGSDEWLAVRCGILTASEMHGIITPTLKPANNEGSRGILAEIVAQRITGYTEKGYQSYAMARGHEDECIARALYSGKYAQVNEVGFMSTSRLGFTVGYSPDGLVGDDGLIECKSRMRKFQIQTIIDGDVPAEFIIQIQTGLMVSGRKWCDFVSYSPGLPMIVIRVGRDQEVIEKIEQAAIEFEAKVIDRLSDYRAALESGIRVIPTERRIEEPEIFA